MALYPALSRQACLPANSGWVVHSESRCHVSPSSPTHACSHHLFLLKCPLHRERQGHDKGQNGVVLIQLLKFTLLSALLVSQPRCPSHVGLNKHWMAGCRCFLPNSITSRENEINTVQMLRIPVDPLCKLAAFRLHTAYIFLHQKLQTEFVANI